MPKNLSFFFITGLWLVGLISVCVIIKSMNFSFQENGSSEPGLNIISNADNSMHSNLLNDESRTAGEKKEGSDNFSDSNGLFFYDKKAFIRYFSDKYPEQELTETYNEALKITNGTHAAAIKVIRKVPPERKRNSFSGSFDIRAVPVPE